MSVSKGEASNPNELPDPSSSTVATLRERVDAWQREFPADWLERLRQDGRAQVRRLALQLESAQTKKERERARLLAMLQFERELWETGTMQVGGVDEAGMGPLAGPVVAAAVIFPPEPLLAGIQDSKQLSEEARTSLAPAIRRVARSVSVGVATVTEIDRLNIYHAGLLAMRRAVAGLSPSPGHLLVDGREIPDVTVPQTRLIRGDSRSYSIAAASIIAKTERDRMMKELDDRFPGFGFAEHKGYPTATHRRALAELGPCTEHRQSFPAVSEFSGRFSTHFYALRDALSAARTEAEFGELRSRLRHARSLLSAGEYRRLSGLIGRTAGRGRRRSPLLPGFEPEV